MEVQANGMELPALTLADYEARIRVYREQVVGGYIGIGRTLLEAREAKVVPHGQWESWVQEVAGFTPRQAQRLMQAATEIRDGSAMARLEMSKALLLLSSGLDEEQREAIAEKAADEGATVKELREELKQAKLQLVKETGVAAEIREALKAAEAKKDELIRQAKALSEGMQARMDEEVKRAYDRGRDEQSEELSKEIRKEFQQKIDRINQDRAALEDVRKDLTERLKAAQAEGSARWDEGFKAGGKQVEELTDELERANRRVARLSEQLDDAKQEAEDEWIEKLEKANLLTARLSDQLKTAKEEADDAWSEEVAELKKDRENLLAAAEEAEQRAASAEEELEALRSGGAGAAEPAWKTLKVAAAKFLAECELMPMNPAALMIRRAEIETELDRMELWARMMRSALDGIMQAEGAVR